MLFSSLGIGETGEGMRSGTEELSGQAGKTATIAHYRKMYDRISSLAKIGVWECDLATDAISWTDEIYDMFEIARGAPIDRNAILLLYDVESRRELGRRRAQAIRDGGSFALNIRIRTAAGNRRWIRLTCEVEQEDGISVRIFGTKQDISQAMAAQDRVQALQAELIQLSRRSAMGTLVATLAHDLNQPLTAIANYVSGSRRALERADPELEMLKTGLDAIADNAHRAGAIIRQLRELTDGSAVRLQRLDPSPLIREAALLVLGECRSEAALDFDFDEDLTIELDPLQMQQVVINLMLNACDAMHDTPSREIRITTGRVGDDFQLCVHDNGHGIGDAVIGTLFESFVTSRADRMGVGLAICRTIVEAHGGHITATNRAEGGACLCVALPIAA
jgi:two-component system sensor kinase FixL